MNDVYSTVCVMLIPNDARGEEHLTLCFCGESVTGVALNQIADRIRLFAQWTPHVASWVEGWDTFRDHDEDHSVATLERTNELVVARSYFEEFHNSQWGWRPHITAIDGDRRPVNSLVTFNRVGLWAAGEHINWRLGSGTPCA